MNDERDDQTQDLRSDADPTRATPPPDGVRFISGVPGAPAAAGLPNVPRIPGFRVLAVLGEGGMGTVYEAEQDSPRRPVALKVIRPGLASAVLLRRFEQESALLARLQHPGIAQVYAAGTADGGAGPQPYFAMELVRGPDIERFASERGLGAAARLELVAKVCDAVQHAHQKGVIHRDLKSSNILVDETGQPKILDFGVARATDSDVNVTRQTEIGEIVGTLSYMSPEQISGDPAEVDTRSDVYSIGVVLYLLLARRLPLDVKGRMLHEVARLIREEEPSRLSTVDRVFRGDVETIVAKALEKDKARRYESPAALAADIRHYLHDEPIVARPPSATYQLQKFARRNKALVTSAAVVFVALVAATAVSTGQAIRARQAEKLAGARLVEAETARTLAEEQKRAAEEQKRLADERRAESERAKAAADAARASEAAQHALADRAADDARGQAAKADAARQFLVDMLGSADPYQMNGPNVTVKQALDVAAKKVDAGSLKGQPAIEASVRQTLAKTYQRLGLFEEARTHARRAIELRQGMGAPGDRDAAEARENAGLIEVGLGRFADARREFEAALAIDRRFTDRDGRLATARVLTMLGDACYRIGDNGCAERSHLEAVAIQRRESTGPSVALGTALSNYSFFLDAMGRFDEAEANQREAVAMLRKVAPEAPNTAAAISMEARILQHTGRADDAVPLFEEALALRRKVFGEKHPDVATSLMLLGEAQQTAGRVKDGETSMRAALDMRRQLFGNDHPDVATAAETLANLLEIRGALDECETLLRDTLRIRTVAFTPEHAAVAAVKSALATILRKKGDIAAAETLYREAVATLRKVLPDSDDLGDTLANLGILLQNASRFADSRAAYEEAQRIYRSRHGAEHPAVAGCLNSLAVLAFLEGKTDEAIELARRTVAMRRRVLPKDHYDLAESLNNLGFMLASAKRGEEAVPLYRESLDIKRRTIGPAPDTNRTASSFAMCLEALGRLDEAKAEYLAAADGWKTVGNPVERSRSLISVGEILVRQGKAAEAETVLRETLELRRANLPEGHWRIAAAQSSLAEALTAQKRFEEAEALLLTALPALAESKDASAEAKANVKKRAVALYEAWGKPEKAAALAK